MWKPAYSVFLSTDITIPNAAQSPSVLETASIREIILWIVAEIGREPITCIALQVSASATRPPSINVVITCCAQGVVEGEREWTPFP